MTVIRSADKIKFDATSTVEVQDTSLRLANLTTTQRNALTASNGDMIYNSTINQFEVYENGTWRSLASDQDVTDAVAALVDSAPGTLDTLNELAAALGDDPNFATTTTNSIATKLPLAGGTMSGDINGNGNKMLFANVYSATNDLPSASTYHGMFAHVHGTGKGYFAHAGAWVELANQSDLTTTNSNVTNLTNNKLNLSGGTMTGTLTLSGAPSSNLHAATKAYVDTAVAGAGGGGTSIETRQVISGSATYTALVAGTYKILAIGNGGSLGGGSGGVAYSSVSLTAGQTITVSNSSGTFTVTSSVSGFTTMVANAGTNGAGGSGGTSSGGNILNLTGATGLAGLDAPDTYGITLWLIQNIGVGNTGRGTNGSSTRAGSVYIFGSIGE